MQVNGTSSNSPLSAYTATQQTTKSDTSSVDSSQFMKILLTQLTHQNPLESGYRIS